MSVTSTSQSQFSSTVVGSSQDGGGSSSSVVADYSHDDVVKRKMDNDVTTEEVNILMEKIREKAGSFPSWADLIRQAKTNMMVSLFSQQPSWFLYPLPYFT